MTIYTVCITEEQQVIAAYDHHPKFSEVRDLVNKYLDHRGEDAPYYANWDFNKEVEPDDLAPELMTTDRGKRCCYVIEVKPHTNGLFEFYKDW